MEPSDDFRPDVERLLTDHYMSWSRGSNARPCVIRVGQKIYDEFLRTHQSTTRFTTGPVQKDRRPLFKTGRMEVDPKAWHPYQIDIREDTSGTDSETGPE